MVSSYKKALQEARSDLAAAQIEADALEVKIHTLRQTVATLARLCNEPSGVEEQMGITDAVRSVLRSAPNTTFTLSEAVQAVRDIGYPLDKQVAPAASIATILNRLVKSREALKVERDGKSGWEWNASVKDMLAARLAAAQKKK